MPRTAEITLVPGYYNDQIFNVSSETEKTLEALSNKFSPQVILEWLKNQVTFFLAEYGVGENLSIPPSYWQEIKKNDDGIGVWVSNLNEYGEQSASFIESRGKEDAVSQGLVKAYQMLTEGNAGEGVVIVSPKELYVDYGSNYDVLNIFRIVNIAGDGSRLVEGRYLLLNGGLTSVERTFLLKWHNREAGVSIDATPEQIVASPQPFVLEERFLREEDSIASYAFYLDKVFFTRFRKNLLGGDNDFSMYEKINQIVAEGISDLRNFLLEGNKAGFLKKLRKMVEESHERWARINGICVETHLQMLASGLLQNLGAFHGGSIGDNSDSKEAPINGESKVITCPHCGVAFSAATAKRKAKCPECLAEINI